MKKRLSLFLISAILLCFGCDNMKPTNKQEKLPDQKTLAAYYDNTGRNDVLSGGVNMIPIQTAKGTFKVWTKRVGNNPRIKVLLLHGGPGATHEYLESFDSFFPQAGIEYYYYDQLESSYSDQPNDTSLWHIDRFVEEVEQVRQALKLDKNNFYLYGQSWGGILALEYALKYPDNLKALIISNMMCSAPDYIKYAEEVLGPQLDPEILADIKLFEKNNDYSNPRYLELISTHYYPKHVLRKPIEDWPEPVVRSFAKVNNDLYVAMQGPSEFGMAGDARIKDWDRKAELSKIKVPTLTMGGTYDTMDPEHMKWMAAQVQHGRYEHCPEGSHLSMYDDQETYYEGLIRFIEDVDQSKFKE